MLPGVSFVLRLALLPVYVIRMLVELMAFPYFVSKNTTLRPAEYELTKKYMTPYITRQFARSAHPKWFVYFHGNLDTIGGSCILLTQLADEYGACAAAIEYPRYGVYKHVVGAPWFWCTHEIVVRDAVAFIDEVLVNRYNAQLSDVVLVGQSIGTGVAAQVAAHYGGKLGATIMISPYTSIFAVGHAWLARLFSPLDFLRTIDVVADIGKVCIIHGSDDTVIPLSHAQALADRAKTRVDIVHGATHDIFYKSDDVFRLIRYFMETRINRT